MSGSFGSVTVTVSASMPASEVATLPDGSQLISVRGRDAAGNWGPVSTASLMIDRTGPTTSGATVSPMQSQGAASIQITATLADARSSISAAEWFVGADPGAGLGAPLQPADGSFDTARETGIATIDLAGKPFGELVISVRARDAAGTWGSAAVATGLVTPADGLFADGFEAGSSARWSGQSGSTRLAVNTAAAMTGRYGLSVTVASGSGGYLSDTTPTAATAYHARFGFDARRWRPPARRSTCSRR